jgi:hypothetical protein
MTDRGSDFDDDLDDLDPVEDAVDEVDEDEYEEEVGEPSGIAPESATSGTRRRPPAAKSSRAATQAALATAPRRGYACADVITAIFLLLTVLSASITILLLANPASPLNPLPAPTYPAVLVIATPWPSDTPTRTFTPEPATRTPLPTSTPTASATRTPTATNTATNTPVFGAVTSAATQAATLEPLPPSKQYTLSPFAFTVKPIEYQANTNKDGCKWQSIVGSVVDLSLRPVKGMAVKVMGSNGQIDEVKYTGTALDFGESGFEFFLGPAPREDRYTVQLLGRTGTPISEAVTVETRATCDQNVAIVSFVQNHAY